MRKAKFPWTVWQWTGPTENIFDLDPEARFFFIKLTEAANG